MSLFLTQISLSKQALQNEVGPEYRSHALLTLTRLLVAVLLVELAT